MKDWIVDWLINVLGLLDPCDIPIKDLADPDAACGALVIYLRKRYMELELKEPNLTPEEREEKKKIEKLLMGCKRYADEHI